MDAELKDQLTMAFAAIGAGLGGIGTVLGIINTWAALNQRRVRLRVKPAFATTHDRSQVVGFSISVTNLSTFPLTINEVGFVGRRGVRGKRLAITGAQFLDGKQLPRRLESREEASAYFDTKDVIVDPRQLVKAYARTSCGETAYGVSPAIKDLQRHVGAFLASRRGEDGS